MRWKKISVRRAVETLRGRGLAAAQVEELLVRCPGAVGLVDDRKLQALQVAAPGIFLKTALLRDPEVVLRTSPQELIARTSEIRKLGVPDEDLVLYI